MTKFNIRNYRIRLEEGWNKEVKMYYQRHRKAFRRDDLDAWGAGSGVRYNPVGFIDMPSCWLVIKPITKKNNISPTIIKIRERLQEVKINVHSSAKKLIWKRERDRRIKKQLDNEQSFLKRIWIRISPKNVSNKDRIEYLNIKIPDIERQIREHGVFVY